MKTVLITGTSSGFGEAATGHFLELGWNVIATLRNPQDAAHWPAHERLLVARLDVQDAASIGSAIEAGIARFGQIDVVINNAGYGLFGVFEGLSSEAIQAQFAVNVFGAMDVIRAILPHFRARRAGTIINVTSGAGAIGFPMASLYCASKFALEGFSESLRYELAPQGIKVRLVEPGGAMKTAFMARVGGESQGQTQIEAYQPFVAHVGNLYAGMGSVADADAVEKVVASLHEAAIDPSDRLRYAPTSDIQALLDARRSSDEAQYHAFTGGMFALAE